MSNLILPGTLPSVNLGGRLITDVSNLKLLVARVSGAGSGNSTFRLGTFGASAGYQVPVGKAFKPKLLKIMPLVVSNQASTLVYADADVGDASNTAFTTPQNFGGSSNIYVPSLVMPWELAFDDNASVPAGKYLGIQSTASALIGALLLYGYEVSV